MSDRDEMPIEIVRLSYVRYGDKYGIRFTLDGQEQQLVIVPAIDPIVLISTLFKTIQVLADPVGPCVNDEPY
jgi:predicted transcriptional regulator